MKNLTNFFVFLFATVAIFFMSNIINSNIAFAADKININTANTTELDTIPEVGPSTAAKIITYRETVGPFLVIEDIMKVSGIKEATFAKLKDYITVDSSSTDSGSGDSGGTSTTTATSTDSIITSTTNSTTNNVSSNTPNSLAVISVHYYQEDLSDYSTPTNMFEASAGRERLAYVGSPVSFEIKYKTSVDLENRTPHGTWTFGDGFSQAGNKVIHTYKYPGEYNVVLNAELSSVSSISRTKVKVLKPNITFSMLPDGNMEIYNKGSNEISLYGFKVQSENQFYTFPIDTIISAGKSVIFPAEYLKIPIAGNEIILLDASGKEIGRNNRNFTLADSQKHSLYH